ncbi:hypothetical protein C8R43DRAFT_1009836 [Mycena crocata]|nr:hypothetical protein C8R43DRAFT_1009836 [Mycena crocata]
MLIFLHHTVNFRRPSPLQCKSAFLRLSVALIGGFGMERCAAHTVGLRARMPPDGFSPSFHSREPLHCLFLSIVFLMQYYSPVGARQPESPTTYKDIMLRYHEIYKHFHCTRLELEEPTDLSCAWENFVSMGFFSIESKLARPHHDRESLKPTRAKPVG